MNVRAGHKLSAAELTVLNCGAGEDSGQSLRQHGNQTSQF